MIVNGFDCPLPDTKIDALAYSIWESFPSKLTRTPIRQIVLRYGGRISTREDKYTSVAYAKNNFEIRLGHFSSTTDDYYVLAHELGHFILHYLPSAKRNPEVGTVVFGEHCGARKNAQASRFAMSLLLPARPFSNLFMSLSGDFSRISSAFGVTEEDAYHRAIELLLIHPNESQPQVGLHG